MRRAQRILSLSAVFLSFACGSGSGGTADDPGADAVEAAVDAAEAEGEAAEPEVVAEVEPEVVPETGPEVAPDGDEAVDSLPIERKVRFVHISDVHVHGHPPFVDGSHVEKAAGVLNARAFDAHFAVATGDYVDYLPDGVKPGEPSAYKTALDALGALKWPLRTTTGNHEYYRDEQVNATQDKAARDAFLAESMGHPLDDAWDVNGVRFVSINSMAGDLWESNAGLVGSYTDDQLAWLRAKLGAGLPTIVFMHHPPNSTGMTAGGDTLCAAIGEHPGAVLGVFAGHLHGFWKGSACGVPYWLVGNVDPDKAFYYEVEVDGEAGTVTIVNESEIPFMEFPTFTCDTTAGTVADPAAAVGSNQVVHAGDVMTNLPGLETVQGDKLEDLPPVLRIDSWDPAAFTWHARFTMGRTQAGFVDDLPGAPCVPIDLRLDGECVVSSSASFEMNVLPVMGLLLGVPVDPSWVARLDVSSLWIEGRVKEASGKLSIEQGLLHLAGSATKALDDLKAIVVAEYCANHIPTCEPGTTGNPACPSAQPDVAFFDQVPEFCDVPVGGFSIRLLMNFLGTYPLDNVVVVAESWTDSRPTSPIAALGAVSEDLFSTAAGMNCEASP